MDLYTIFDLTPPVSYLPNLIPHNSGIANLLTLLLSKEIQVLAQSGEIFHFTKASLGRRRGQILLK